MISALLLAAATLDAPTVIEVIDPSSDRIYIKMVSKRESDDDQSEASWQLWKELVPQGTIGYTREQLWQYGSFGGSSLRLTVASDHVSVGVTVPRGQIGLGTDLMAELIGRPLFSEDLVKSAEEELPFRRVDPWTFAVHRRAVNPKAISTNFLRFTPQALMNRERTRVVISGAFEAGVAAEEMSGRWPIQTSMVRRPNPPAGANAELRLKGSPVTMVSLVGPERPIGEMPAGLLAACALGLGKSSSVWRVIRHQERLSYRQEAFLVPSPKGFRLQVTLAFKPREDQAEVAEKVRAALLKDVESWDEAILTRTVGAAELAFESNLLPLPFYLQPDRPLTTSAEDAIYYRAWAAMKGAPTTLGSLQNQMGVVGLGTWRDTARSFLVEAKAETFPAE
jgi:predicted Zn-dependent peptidase